MTDEAEILRALLAERRSVRAFLDREVAPAQIERLLAAASLAPSGNNTQPWRIDVVTGAARLRLVAAIAAQEASGMPPVELEYPYYPDPWPEPHLARRRALGWALYGLIGVTRGDKAGMAAHHARNLRFFDAPACLILSVDRGLGAAAYIDAGLFLQSLALAAVSEGLGSCLQAAITPYHASIRAELGMDPRQKILCGIALGYPDSDARINALRANRVPVAEFARFHRD